MRTVSILFLFCLTCGTVRAQKHIVVMDESSVPIEYANVYTATKNGRILSTVCDSNGVATICFPYDTLCFSHVCYKSLRLAKGDIGDTVFLHSKMNMISEVIVRGQANWIEELLKRFIENRESQYRPVSKQFDYTYCTTTLNDSSGYSFSSKGKMDVPSVTNGKFQIAPHSNTIYYMDKSAGMDFSNLQRMVYEDMAIGIDKDFIKEHRFQQNLAYQSSNKDFVQIMFSSKKFDEDKGYLVIDTTTCHLVEMERSMGTSYNVKEKTSAPMRAIASSLKGFKYREWIVYNHTSYVDIDGAFYPKSYKYKLYISSQSNAKRNGEYFVSTESSLSFDTLSGADNSRYLPLPRPHYMMLIKTKKMRLEEEALQRVDKTYQQLK